MTDKLTTGPTVEEQIRHQEYSVHAAVAYNDDAAFNKEAAILDSLRELQSIRSAELPVEPDEVTTLIEGSWSELNAAATRKYIDTLKSALQVAQQERDAAKKQVLDYGGLWDLSEYKSRAEKAEAFVTKCCEIFDCKPSELAERIKELARINGDIPYGN